MSFLLYELAVNPDIQERLVREIQEDSKRSGGKFDYSSILNLTYMDMVISGKNELKYFVVLLLFAVQFVLCEWRSSTGNY